ncbi:hypothetical protein [Taylorella equigenitalis]|uniref:hypothetical protein n=1 Tax=Taylorella equigenitalis TaxID=29575 RepID=UPI000BACDA5D|nr:hypothetical protein [Taylorella equigenitalis]ASY38675.1 hypothetical protein CA604_00665 [Taylorella equigenitalis]
MNLKNSFIYIFVCVLITINPSLANNDRNKIKDEFIKSALETREAFPKDEIERLFEEGKKKKWDSRSQIVYRPSPQGKIFCSDVLFYPTAESAYECAFSDFIPYMAYRSESSPESNEMMHLWISIYLELARILLEKYDHHYAYYYSKYDNKDFWQDKVNHLQNCLDKYTANFSNKDIDMSCITPIRSPYLNKPRRLPKEVLRRILEN